MQDLIASRLDFLCEIAVTAVPNIKAGSVKALANLSGRRSAALPDLPTAGGTADCRRSRPTPGPRCSRRRARRRRSSRSCKPATAAAMDSPGLREQLDGLAATLVAPERRSSDYLGRFVKSEFDKWGEAIRAGGALPKRLAARDQINCPP